MGLVQRSIEAAGIATISITLSKDITAKVRPPRALDFGFPLGHPIAYPGQVPLQLRVLRLLLKYLQEINSPGTILEIDLAGGDNGAAS